MDRVEGEAKDIFSPNLGQIQCCYSALLTIFLLLLLDPLPMCSGPTSDLMNAGSIVEKGR